MQRDDVYLFSAHTVDQAIAANDEFSQFLPAGFRHYSPRQGKRLEPIAGIKDTLRE